jgi:4-hydroxy-2-oxoheptanedioate aldolase
LIRNNPVKTKLMEGRAATLVGGLYTPEIVEFVGQFGFEGILIDTEHAPTDWQMISHMCMASDLWGMAPIVRVNHNEPSLISRTLDVGASGVIVPHTNTVEDVKQAVAAAKYYPLGSRGTSNTRHTYGHNLSEYYKLANEQVLVIGLLEEIRAIDNLDALLTVDGMDVFLIGPGDLAQTMGLPGQMTHPKVVEVVEHAITKISNAGKIAGTTGDIANIQGKYDLGVKLFLTNWAPWVRTGANAYLEIAKRLGN